jgi:PAS domain S-box-containing protein
MKTLQNNPQFRAFASSIDYGIIIGNKKGLIIDFNQTALDMFGYTEDELRNIPISAIMPERFRSAHSHGMKRYNETGTRKVIGNTLRLYGLHKDGHEFPLELHVSSWKNPEGEEYFTASVRKYSALENNLSWILASSAVATVTLLGLIGYLAFHF